MRSDADGMDVVVTVEPLDVGSATRPFSNA
jgi:hypothetical protein